MDENMSCDHRHGDRAKIDAYNLHIKFPSKKVVGADPTALISN